MKIYKVEIVKHLWQNTQLIHNVDEIKYFVKKSNCDEYFNEKRNKVIKYNDEHFHNKKGTSTDYSSGSYYTITKSEEVTED